MIEELKDKKTEINVWSFIVFCSHLLMIWRRGGGENRGLSEDKTE